MEISSIIAQEIVLELKGVLSQEINFMNSDSLIIASTDTTRIGDYHEGASVVMKTNLPLIIDKDGIYKGSRKGINIPVEFEKNVIGVIGITGERERVEKNGRIIKKMTEILIREDYIKDFNLKKQDRSRYIITRILNYQLKKKDNHNNDVFNYNYSIPHYCAVGSFTSNQDFNYEELYRLLTTYVNTSTEVISVIEEHKLYLYIPTTTVSNLQSWLTRLSEQISTAFRSDFLFGVGPESVSLKTASEAFEAALVALNWNKSYRKAPYISFDHMDIGLLLSSVDKQYTSLYVKKVLQSIPETERSELRKVLMTYGNMNKSITRSSELLFIHKNSFQYKLNKLKDYTGYDPKVLNDYVILHLAFVLDQTESI